MSSKEITTYQQLVEFTIKNGGIIIADFNNSWCTPCKLITPHIQSNQKELHVPVAHIDCEKSDQLTTKFDIFAIPTYVLVKKAGGDIERTTTVVSANVQKLRKLFQNAADMRNLRK